MNRKDVMIYALDASYALTGVIDEYTSFQYTRSWAGIGDWTINLSGAQKASLQALQDATYITVAGIGTGLISKITEDIKASGISYKVQGVELKGLAQKRIVMNTETLNDKPCKIIETLLTDNLLNPDNANRAIGGTIINVDVGEAIEYTAKYEVLADAIKSLCETYNLGWNAEIINGAIVWTISTGTNRTLGQTDNEVLLIGYDLNTLDASTIEETKVITNTAIVAGAGEGEQRTIEIVNDTNTGLARTELYVDARSEEDLQAKGNEALSKYGTDNITDIKPSNLLVNRLLNNEFALGDIGTLIEHNNANAQLTQIVYIFEGASVDINFSFGYGIETIADAIKASTANYQQLLKTESSGSSGGAVTSVNGKTGAVVLKTSDITNDSGYITNSYHDSTKADAATTYTKTQVDTALSGKAAASHTHTKSQITDFPAIPTKTSDLTNDSGYITNSYHDSTKADTATTYTKTQVDNALSGKAAASHTHTKSQISDFPTLATVATSGAYSDLSGLPTIPTKTSDLTNDSSYLDAIIQASYGITKGSNKSLRIVAATESEIDAKTNASKPITPSKLDYAVKAALANNGATWTDTEKANARLLLNTVSADSYNPVAKTSSMQQAVGVDANGKLWTAQGGGGTIGEWVEFTPDGSGFVVANTCYKKIINGVVYLRGACRYTPSISNSGTVDFLTDIGDDYTPTELVVLPLAGDYANFLLYVNLDGKLQIRNRTNSSRSNMWFRIDCCYAL